MDACALSQRSDDLLATGATLPSREATCLREPLHQSPALRASKPGVSEAQSEWRRADTGARWPRRYQFSMHQRIHRGDVSRATLGAIRSEGAGAHALLDLDSR